MSELREDLDRAFNAIDIGGPPVERVLRDGRRLRTRRRVAVVAGALAVAAIVAGYPALGHRMTSSPAPATSHDPVITDRPGAGANGIIGQGKIGRASWQVRLEPTPAAGGKPGDVCFQATVSPAHTISCGPASENDGTPAAFGGASDSTYETTLGSVAADVTYFVLTFTDGQHLKLIPVTYAGTRYVAWLAPVTMPVKDIVAHLGGQGSDRGQTSTAVPFDGAGQEPVFGLWQAPGQAAVPRVQAVIGSGTAGGHSWSVTAYQGPWGTCFVTGDGSSDCVPLPRLATTDVTGWDGPPGPVFGSAAPGVARITVRLTDGTTVSVQPVTVGNERLWAFWSGDSASPKSWIAYSASGREIGSGT
jgi:hypothetical protein